MYFLLAFVFIILVVFLVVPQYRSLQHLLGVVMIGGVIKLFLDYWCGLPISIGTTGSIQNHPEMRSLRIVILVIGIGVGAVYLLSYATP